MAFVNWYNFKTISDPTISDAKGSGDFVMQGTGVAYNSTAGYLDLRVNTASESGTDIARAESDNLSPDWDYSYTDSFSVISFYNLEEFASVTIFSTCKYLDKGYIILFGNGLSLQDQYSNDYRLGGGADPDLDPTAGRHTMIASYEENSMKVFQDGQQLSNIVWGETLAGQLWYTGGTPVLGCHRDEQNYRWKWALDGKIHHFSHKNDAMNTGQIKTMDAYLRGML